MTAYRPESVSPTAYASHRVTTTVFWVGEGASSANDNITNTSTEWDNHAGKHFGGIDNPSKRTKDGLPTFAPQENPFYFALPASEYDNDGLIKGAREASPWAAAAKSLPANDSRSLFKGRWIAVHAPGSNKIVYGQWLDTGPSGNGEATRDYKYVFGGSAEKPKNSFGLKAGIDLSPAMAYQLGFRDLSQASGEVVWTFVDAKDVPAGLWTKYPAIDNTIDWN